jgi:hypothetical protein
LQRFFGLFLLGLLIESAQALPIVEWRYPSFPLRTVFRVPDTISTNVMLRVTRVGNMPVTRNAFLACGPDGTPLPLRVLHAGDGEVALALEAPASRSGFCAVYYGGIPSNAPVSSPAAVTDTAPLAIGMMSLPGRAVPTSWERLRHMLKSPLGQIRTPYRTAGFDGIGREIERVEAEKEAKAEMEAKSDKDAKPKKDRRRGTGGGVKLAFMRSFLLCSREGTYRFAVDCKDAGYVLVDSERVAAWPGEHARGSWQLGGPVSLKAGMHCLEVYNAFNGEIPNLRVGWVTPGGKDVLPLSVPDLVAACEVMDTRAECINRTLQPGFEATPVQSYSFRGIPDVFVSVRFKNITENWVAPGMESFWRFGDGTQSTETNPVHIYRAPDVYKASLEVRDTLGFVAGYSESVDCRQVQHEEFAVSFDMAGLPAVCFGRDKVVPFLRLQGVGPSGVAIDVNWEIQFRSGAVEKGHQEVVPRNQTQMVSLAPAVAGELETLHWSVSHRQARLAGELIRFVRPPFSALPARIEGDRLYDAKGTRLVLVPKEEALASRPAPADPLRHFGRMVCVDDSLAVAGFREPGCEPFDRILARLLQGRLDEVRYVALPPWEQFQESYGPLRKLVDVPAALRLAQADVAILSIGLQDLLAVKDIASFERQVAALSDIVVTSMKIPTVWVTPPPYPSAPDRSRVLAATIRRVAEARGIPVADLFTAFSCASDRRHVFFQENPLILSDQGHRLAGQQIVRALMGE